MAYNALNNLIDAYIYANGVQAITGSILNGILKQMVSELGDGYHLMGVAVPSTQPDPVDYSMAYFAATAGTYTNFDGIVLSPGEAAVILSAGNGTWEKRTFFVAPTKTSDLDNDSGFITNAVTDLVNYYTKTEVDTNLENYPTLAALATALEDYYTKAQIDGQKADTDAALADRYTKSETDTKLADYYRKAETYDKDEVDSIIATLNRQEYIVAWDGIAAPDVSAIPAGVTVTYSGTTYTGILAASASTVNKIYMVWNGTAYDMYGTSQDGGYSWVPMGTTSVDLSQYATKSELNQLRQELGTYEENPDFVRVILDSERKFLFGIKTDGSIEWGAGVPTPVREYIDDVLSGKVDKEEGKSLIESGLFIIEENPVFAEATVDSDGKLLSARKMDGTLVENGIETDSLNVGGGLVIGGGEAQKQVNISDAFVMGAIVNGRLQGAVSRIATEPFIDVRAFGLVTITIANGYYYNVFLYSGENEYTVLLGTDWSNRSGTFDVSKYNYMRLSLRRADNAYMTTDEGINVNVSGIMSYASRTLGIKAETLATRTYSGEKVSLERSMQYYCLCDRFAAIYQSPYSYDVYTQQGSACYGDILFMLRHHAVCEVLNLKTMRFINEFVINDLTAWNPHCNSGTFSKQFPSGNSDFPYLYTGRCAYGGDSEGETDAAKNACYVLDITTTGATLAQTITFANDHRDFYTSENGGAWDWVLDAERNILYAIGYGGDPREYIVKGFDAPAPSAGGTVELTDSDVIEQWVIPDDYDGINHAFQGGTVFGDYFIIPISRGGDIESEAVLIYDKISHRKVASFPLIEEEVGEAQSVSVYNGSLILVSKNGRIDRIFFN